MFDLLAFVQGRDKGPAFEVLHSSFQLLLPGPALSQAAPQAKVSKQAEGPRGEKAEDKSPQEEIKERGHEGFSPKVRKVVDRGGGLVLPAKGHHQHHDRQAQDESKGPQRTYPFPPEEENRGLRAS